VEADKMASLGRMLAGIVHEINTPVGSILSNNEVTIRSLDKLKSLLEGPDAAPLEKVRSIVETCRSLVAVDKIACERISSVVRGLKTFVREEPAEFRKANLHEALQDTLKLTHGEFRRRITVETDFGDIPTVECQPQMLNQVFLNLLVNAGHAIGGEGKIVVRTRREGDQVHISISDTGSGIKPEDYAKIFGSGFTTKPVGIGTGLGLSISRRIIEEVHGGRIDFESEVGVGTTFHIRIPIQQAGTQVPPKE
jgi:two-component system NtrC family sensor kinase